MNTPSDIAPAAATDNQAAKSFHDEVREAIARKMENMIHYYGAIQTELEELSNHLEGIRYAAKGIVACGDYNAADYIAILIDSAMYRVSGIISAMEKYHPSTKPDDAL